MKSFFFPICLTPLVGSVALSCFTFSALAQTAPASSVGSKPIVKVVGSDGRVTYTDRSVQSAAGKVTEMRRGAVSATLAASPEQAKADKDKSGDLVTWARDQQAKIDAQKLELAKVSTQLTKESCDRSRQSLAVLTKGGRIARPTANGEIGYLTDAQITQERSQAEADVVRLCT